MGSSTHQAKRPYAGAHSQSYGQSTITSYFSPSSSPPIYNTNSTSSTQSDTHSSSAILPASVQSNLISVGMRIRKSVPEGYKTGGYSAFTLFSDNCPPTTPPLSTRRAQSRSTYENAKRELMPFCGILKVGGLAQQEATGGNASEEDEVPGEENVPALSSHCSTTSNSSVNWYDRGRNGNKRRFDEDEEPNTRVLQHTEIWQDDELELSPKSKPADQAWIRLGSVSEVRVLAVPKSRRRCKGVNQGLIEGSKGASTIIGQENTIDFGEADFLEYSGWEREVGVQEVVMGDT